MPEKSLSRLLDRMPEAFERSSRQTAVFRLRFSFAFRRAGQ